MLADSGYGASFLLGVGTGYGPALLPGLTFLGAGMACGEVLTGRRGPALPLAILLAAGAVALWELGDGPAEAARRFLAHRWTNHPGYCAVGIISTAGIAAAAAFLAALFGLALAGPAGRGRLALGLPGRWARLRAGWQGAAARGALRGLRRGPAGSPPAPAG